MVEEAQRQARHESVDPDRQSGKLHRDPVEVHAVDAVSGHLAAQKRTGLDLVLAAESARNSDGGCPQTPQGCMHPGAGGGVAAQPARQPPLDPVHCRHQEVPRAHRDVGAAEVEEGRLDPGDVARGRQCIETGEMLLERGLQGVVEQVLHGEGLREVAAGALAHARAVVEVDAPGGHLHLVAGLGGNVGGLALEELDGEVLLGQRQLRLQQALVDRAEGADRQRPEIHRTLALGAEVDQHGRKRGAELCVGQRRHRLDGRARAAHIRVAGEQPAVVCGQRPGDIAGVYGAPQLLDVGPHRGGRPVEDHRPAAAVLGEASRQPRQRMVGVAGVRAVREAVHGLGVGDEQQPEQDHHHLLVGRPQFLRARRGPDAARHRVGQRGHRLGVHPLPQSDRQVGGEPVRRFEDLLDLAAGIQRLRGEQQPQVSGVCCAQQRQVGLHVGLGPALAAHAGVGTGRIEPDLAAAGQQHPVGAVGVGVGQRQRHRGDPVEAGRRRVEGLVVGAEHGGGPAVAIHLQQMDVVGVLLQPEAEPLRQLPAPQAQQRPARPHRRGPVGPLRQARTELLCGQQAHVAQPGLEPGVLRRVEPDQHLL